MADRKPLIDMSALGHRLRRIQPDALFLHWEAAREVQEKLRDVNRAFTSPAIITAHPEPWSDAFPDATLYPADEVLPFAAESHDLVIHALALHRSNDPLGQIIQCRRALRPDGLFIATTFGGATLSTLRQALRDTELALLGGISPRVLPMAEIRDFGDLVQRAGLSLSVADAHSVPVTYGSVGELLQDIRAMGEANAMTDRMRRFLPRQFFTALEAAYPRTDDRILAEFELIYLTGWAPHASQQQPMRPGSAEVSLASILDRSDNDEDRG